MRKIIFSILLFISCIKGISQSGAGNSPQYLRFKIVELPKEQPLRLITAMTQDSTGFMWFATWSGLHRFDGLRFTDYLHDALNPNSIASDRTECVFADKDRYIYVGTYGNGLDQLNPLTGIFKHFTFNKDNPNSLSSDTVTAIAKGRNGKIWVGTINGLNEFDPTTGKCKRFVHDDKDAASISENNIRVIYEDHDGTVWIGTKDAFIENGHSRIGGLNKFDSKTGKFTRYLNDPKNPLSLINNTVTAVFEDSKGNFWVGTAGDGLHLMNRKDGTFQRLEYDPKHPENLSRPAIINKYPDIVVDHITFITEDKSGRIWIGTLENGINIYDPDKKTVTHFGSTENNINKLANNEYWRAFRSKEDIMWIIAWSGNGEALNLYQINPFEYRLPATELGFIPFTFLENADGSMWIGTDSCLQKKNTDGTIEMYPVKINGKPTGEKNFVSSIIPDNKGGLWISPQHGLFHFDTATKVFKGYFHDNNNNESLGADGILLLVQESKDKLWAATSNGLDLFEIPSGRFTHYTHNANDSNTISDNNVNSLLKLKNGELMIGGQNVADRFNIATGKFTHYKLSGYVNTFLEDDEGILWAGTQAGLFKFDNTQQIFIPFTEFPQALNSGTYIFQLTEDKKQNLFIATVAGFTRLNRKTNEISTYGESNGMVPEISYARSMLVKRDGELLVTNNTEYFHFKPGSSLKDLPQPTVLFSGFLLRDTMTSPGAGSVLTKPIFETTEIHLKHSQNVFSILYSIIDYTEHPANTPAMYMLENYDQRWRKSNAENIANYVNVEPGTYIFKVKTTNSTGIWVQKEIKIIINPPWWKTVWAYVLYGFIFIVFSFIANRMIRNRIIEKENEKNRQKELAHAKEIEKAYNELKVTQTQLIQSEKMASLGELTAGIAHEIQNPLNFVNNFSDVNNELIDEMNATDDVNELKTIAGDIKQNNEKISYHGKRADAIVKNMLLHSQRSSGLKEPTDINALADEYFRLAYHGLRAKDPRDAAHKSFNATMDTSFDKTIGNINIIPQDMGRVLLNLYNNAFYVVNEKKKSAGAGYAPTVLVTTKKVNNHVEIRVSDNGNGIPQNIIGKIFQPFFTTKPTGQGTGLGLSLSYDIVKAHGGEIKVESKEGEGTEFIIQLPIA